MSNNSLKLVLVIGPRIQLAVSAQWCQTLYVKVQGKMVYKNMHKIVFQSIKTFQNI